MTVPQHPKGSPFRKDYESKIAHLFGKKKGGRSKEEELCPSSERKYGR